MQITEPSAHAFLSDFTEACRYLESFINYEQKRDFQYNPRTFNLVRMEQLLFSLGNPHQDLKIIHIAGSKGKGSTAAMVASILTASGLRTGLYTSPHLISPRERFRIDGCLISEEDFLDGVNQLVPQAESMRQAGNPPTFFEIYTAVGFLYFPQSRVDFAVLEVGLGGRLDATNVVSRPEVSVITPISLEHTNILGHSLPEIAAEKAGIIKPGCTVVLAPQAIEAHEIIREICQKNQSPCIDVERTTTISGVEAIPGGQRFSLTTAQNSYLGLETPLLGGHQRINAATALCAIEALDHPRISDETIHEGLAQVVWPGRMQVIPGSPRLVLDGAHSPASVQALRCALEDSFEYDRLIMVIGLSQDKDIQHIGQEICTIADLVVLTKASDMPRAVEPSQLEEQWTSLASRIKVVQNARNALEEAFGQAGKHDLICVTGSLYLVGEVLDQLGYKPDRLCSGFQSSHTMSGSVYHKAQEENAIQSAVVGRSDTLSPADI